MSGLIINSVPTIVLAKIHPATVTKNYHDGKYVNMKLPDKLSTSGLTNSDTSLNYGINESAALFTYRGKNDMQQIIATTNHVSYALYDSKGQELPMGAKCPGGCLFCHYCHLEYKTNAIGIPITYKEQRDPKNSQKHIIFYCEGLYCSYECALSALKTQIGRNSLARDSSYNYAEELLRYLYKLAYPSNPILIPAPDHRLLKSNGGSLTESEFRTGSHTYIKLPGMIFAPVKFQYLQQ